jgi:hypothetical protein
MDNCREGVEVQGLEVVKSCLPIEPVWQTSMKQHVASRSSYYCRFVWFRDRLFLIGPGRWGVEVHAVQQS